MLVDYMYVVRLNMHVWLRGSREHNQLKRDQSLTTLCYPV